MRSGIGWNLICCRCSSWELLLLGEFTTGEKQILGSAVYGFMRGQQGGGAKDDSIKSGQVFSVVLVY